jgi:molecular chaperone DnaJ
MAQRDYYDVLELDKNATPEQIKKAYKRLAFKYHPDQNPDSSDAEERFKEVYEAYSVLSKEETRARYDRFGHAGVNNGMGGGFDGGNVDPFEFFRSFMGGTGFGDIFGDVFGGGQRSSGPRKQSGGDIQIKLKLSLEEIAEGGAKKLKIKRFNTCSTCNGKGGKPGSKPVQCSTCNGSGQVRQVSRSLFGQVVNIQVCPTCNGEGFIITDSCSACHGEGRVKEESVISIDIPAGVPDQSQLTVRSEGHVGLRGGPRGDLYVLFMEKEHDLFSREEDDIVFELPVAIHQMVLGESFEVPTLWGNVKIDIPNGTQSGKLFRLRGKGMPNYRTQRKGDQIVRVNMWTPKTLSSKAKKLFEEMRKHEELLPPDPNDKSFWQKMRDKFE